MLIPALQEIDEGKLLIDAAHEGGAKRILWSGLESFIDATNGRLSHVDHFEGKAVVTKYACSKIHGTDVAFVLVDAGLYMTNLSPTSAMRLRPKGDGTYVISLACKKDAKLPLIDMVSDYGLFVRLGIEDEEYAKGGEIFTSGEELDWTEVTKQLSEGLPCLLCVVRCCLPRRFPQSPERLSYTRKSLQTSTRRSFSLWGSRSALRSSSSTNISAFPKLDVRRHRLGHLGTRAHKMWLMRLLRKA